MSMIKVRTSDICVCIHMICVELRVYMYSVCRCWRVWWERECKHMGGPSCRDLSTQLAGDECTWVSRQLPYLEHIVLSCILSFFNLTDLLPDSCIRGEITLMNKLLTIQTKMVVTHT